ncbi:hypothetical protein GUJ93_ZPchr0004g38191 [Zizania palustris]|uniref:DUF3700 domain-containing protein n=1 Tax=Zizania palustris TaxID=103762 RepID=A0A8J5VZS3_ZIZPA|nr:hypothetical protein GUJ93_ZPchr0004g38191 [Zizania palustris]
MLAIFQKQVAHAPAELNSPRGSAAKAKRPDEILREFHAKQPAEAFSTSFGGGASLACVAGHARTDLSGYERMFCGLDDIYCVFMGRLDNLSSLIRQYGLCGRSTNEALLVIEAYRTLRDRGPYPADQVVKDLSGSFAFVVFDNKSGAVFAALVSARLLALHSDLPIIPRATTNCRWLAPRGRARTATCRCTGASRRTGRW